MDSLRVPKGGSKPSGAISLAFKFNADEQSVEDVSRRCDSQSNSPQQNSEDLKRRRDFLQGNFFQRKRSSSIEGASSPGGTLINSLASSLLVQLAHGNKSDSDTDTEPDIIRNCRDPESVDIIKSWANLRSKAKSKSSVLPKKDEASSTSSTMRRTFLRKRNKNSNSPASGKDPQPKKETEIESGVEMLEDMILQSVNNSGSSQQDKNDHSNQEDKVTLSKDKISFTKQQRLDSEYDQSGSCNGEKNQMQSDFRVPLIQTAVIENIKQFVKKMKHIILYLLVFGCLVKMPLPDFFRGVLACLFTISLCFSIVEAIKSYIDRMTSGHGPERTKFEIPDYSTMPIYEIPAAEEHKPLKSYFGWMNEINNYDPSNYHISMTQSVYVRLDGSVLRLSNTSVRIPKRAMWNEQLIDKNSIAFTRNRCFNLLGCRIEMCPRGLARKRHFSRKYPIQLIIKNSDLLKQDEQTDKRIPVNEKSKDIDRTKGVIDQQDSRNNPPEYQYSINSNSNDSVEDKSDRINGNDTQRDLNLWKAVMTGDLQTLQETEDTVWKDSVPCGDETRILLFARCDREKEDWYRRFYAASIGAINDQELHIPDIVMVTEEDVINADKDETSSTIETRNSTEIPKKDSNASEEGIFEGLLMTTCAARNPPEYIAFMSKYQKACSTSRIPVMKTALLSTSDLLSRRNRRKKRKENELWKGIDQSLYLGPSGSVVWANVLIGRILYSCLNDATLVDKLQEFIQRKLSATRLPSFMEDVVISEVYLGDTAPLVHRVSQPLLDERGTWFDADVTYEGLVHVTLTTKLNLMRLKRQQNQGNIDSDLANHGFSNVHEPSTPKTEKFHIIRDGPSSQIVNCAIYDSNAESSGASSSDSENPPVGTADSISEQQTFYTAQPSSRRLLRIVDRITTSHLFQTATEIPYIQRAIENMNTKITLRVELKGLVSRIVVNLPPPPSDRIWIGFRGPPRLWVSAKPAFGDHAVDYSIITSVIESKLCDEVSKYLVYPNMVDVIVPFLGQSTYKE